MTNRAHWWRTAVFYEIYVRSFADAGGGGIGDLPGIIAHLDHLSDLGVDALWLKPERNRKKDRETRTRHGKPSPQADRG